MHKDMLNIVLHRAGNPGEYGKYRKNLRGDRDEVCI